MLSWVGRFLSTSIGKKVAMALTGLGLIGFLIGHLAGNLTLYADDTGEAFNGYAETLESNPALPIIEIGLLLFFIAHISLGLKVSLEKPRGAPRRLRVARRHGPAHARVQHDADHGGRDPRLPRDPHRRLPRAQAARSRRRPGRAGQGEARDTRRRCHLLDRGHRHRLARVARLQERVPDPRRQPPALQPADRHREQGAGGRCSSSASPRSRCTASPPPDAPHDPRRSRLQGAGRAARGALVQAQVRPEARQPREPPQVQDPRRRHRPRRRIGCGELGGDGLRGPGLSASRTARAARTRSPRRAASTPRRTTRTTATASTGCSTTRSRAATSARASRTSTGSPRSRTRSSTSAWRRACRSRASTAASWTTARSAARRSRARSTPAARRASSSCWAPTPR